LIDDVKIPLEFMRIQAARLIDWKGNLPHPEFDLLLKSIEQILVSPQQAENFRNSTKQNHHLRVRGYIKKIFIKIN